MKATELVPDLEEFTNKERFIKGYATYNTTKDPDMFITPYTTGKKKRIHTLRLVQ